jgi:tRNA (guanine-N7-)-methyltransferase
MCARPLSDVLHHYLIPWLQRDWPLDWPAAFGRSAPLVVDIGFGNGQFLSRQAEDRPDANVVGIELSWGWVQHLVRRLDEAGLTHVRLIHGEAQVALQHLFSPNSIADLFINFPDPWPKKRHHYRRLIQAELLRLVHDRLAPRGRVTIATDHPDYATWISAMLERQTALRPCFSTTAVPELTGRTPTKYEQRARLAQLPISYFVWDKPFASPPVAPTQRGESVPHVVLEGPHDIEKTLSTCKPRTWHDIQQGVEVSTTLIRAYRELTYDSWLVELAVKEGKLWQQIGVTLMPRSQGQVLVKLSAIGFPRPTWGVQRAIWRVAQMLQESNPQLRILWMSMGAREPDTENVHESPACGGAIDCPSVASPP